ncbi:thioredoxin family protein [Archaeoglobus neptunius]|uniref:thioredoxin family protein n=1 Tax=Archaeoglobus neptunius TaxID=2798580 RepID=UPI0019282DC3|nr:thioredoxin family protein [Archaeoglobus neptunius]
MRSIYILIAVAGIALIAISQFSERVELTGWYSYTEGKAVSEKEAKKMLVFIGTDSCSICKRFKTFFNSNKTAMEFIKENFIPVYVDAAKEKPPVPVTFVPVFCVGFADNLSCFSAVEPGELMEYLKQYSQ